MTTVKEIGRVTPCDTGRLSHVLCDVTLDDGTVHRVCAERDHRGDWRLDRTYPNRDLQAILLSAAGCLADAIEEQQARGMFASGRQAAEAVAKELWRYTPTNGRLKAIGCDVRCNEACYRVSATRDKSGWSLDAGFIDRHLHSTVLRAVIQRATIVERELSGLRRQLSNRTSTTSR